MPNLQADIPLANSPLATIKDANGNVIGHGEVTEAWFIFLIQLLRRTGGMSGGDGQLTIGDVLALEAEIPFPIDIAQQVSTLTIALQQVMASVAAIQQSLSAVGESFSPVSSVNSVSDQTLTTGTDIPHVTEMTFARV